MAILNDFASNLLVRGLNKITVQKHLCDVKHFLNWASTIHHLEVQDVQVDDAQAYIEYLQMPVHQLRPNQTGAYSPSTIRRKVGVLRQFFDFIHKEM